MKNTVEIAKFPATVLLGGLSDTRRAILARLVELKVIEESSTVEIKSKAVEAVFVDLKEAQKDLADEEKRAAAVQTVRSFFPKDYLAALDSLGVEVPTDLVNIYLTPASLIFDLYTFAAAVPTAPLAKTIHQNKIQKMAENLDAEVVNVPKEVLNTIKAPLENDAQWQEVQITGRFKAGEETRFIQLKTMALEYFPQTLTTVISLFGELDAKAESAS